MRDSQRKAIYTWEETVWGQWPKENPAMSLAECQALVDHVWRDYWPDSRPPIVLDGRGRRRGNGGRWHIKLPRFARARVYVLHEIAHSLLWNANPPHNKEFARLFLELIGHYTSIPVREAKSLAVHQKPRRVHFAQSAGVPKRKL